MRKLPLKLKIFLNSIFLFTFLFLFTFIKSIYVENKDIDFKVIVFFGLLAILTESFSVVFNKISFSTTFAITTAVYILFGPLTTIIVTIIGITFSIFKEDDKYKHILNQPWFVTLFNYCVYILQILGGNYIYLKMGGTLYLQNPITNVDIIANIPPIIIFSVVSCAINWLIISIMFSLLQNKNILYILKTNMKLLILNIVAMMPFAVILALLFKQYTYIGVLIFMFPIMLARYTFSLYINSQSQYVDTVNALMLAMEARDKYTEGHSQRVAELVKEIAKELKYNDWAIDKLNIASLLHDVGKIGIDDCILNKPGKLTDEEYSIIKSHPEIGYNILKDVKNLKDVIHIVKHHHERYDGKGYPDGMSGDELNLDVYIVQLADCVDAMTTDRPYKKALTPERVVSELENNSGTQFHPKVVNAYLNLLKKQNRNIQG